MGLLGNGFDDPQSQAIMALSGGLLRGDFGGGLLAANQAVTDSRKQAMQNKLLEAQLRNYDSEIEARKLAGVKDARTQAMFESLFKQPGGSEVYGQGQLGSGTLGVVPPAPGQSPFPAPQPQGSRLANNSIDNIAMISALTGKDLLPAYKFAKEGIERKPGTFYEDLQGRRQYVGDPTKGLGFENGAITMMPGAENIAALAGQTARAQEEAKASSDLIKVLAPDGSERLVPRSQAIRAAQPQPQPAQPRPMARPGALTQPGDSDRQMILQSEMKAAQGRLASATNPDEQRRANEDIAALGRELGSGPMQASPTTAQTIEKTKQLKQAEADVMPTAQRENAIANANYLSSVLDMALKHPGLPTATGLSGTLDPRNYLPGTDAKNFGAVMDQLRGGVFLQAYQGLKGGGAITDIEGTKGSNAIARLSTAQSTEEFTKALKELQEVVTNGVTRMKSGMKASNGATGSFEGDNTNVGKDQPKAVLDTLPKTAPKGQRVRDTATGKILKFNGLSWTEEK